MGGNTHKKMGLATRMYHCKHKPTQKDPHLACLLLGQKVISTGPLALYYQSFIRSSGKETPPHSLDADPGKALQLIAIPSPKEYLMRIL